MLSGLLECEVFLPGKSMTSSSFISGIVGCCGSGVRSNRSSIPSLMFKLNFLGFLKSSFV